MDEIICYCKQITKSDTEKAILNGAFTFEDIQKTTGACTGNQCKMLNPSGNCCSLEIFAILKKSRPPKSNTCSCCSQ